MFGTRIIANYPLIKETMFHEYLRPIPGNSRSQDDSVLNANYRKLSVNSQII